MHSNNDNSSSENLKGRIKTALLLQESLP